jgi:sterol desaturase/sphingolipid hydroxylase (fatty acid hydroxylase superfamily)
MPMVTDLLHWTGFEYLFNVHKRLFWGYILISLVVAFVYLYFTRTPFSRVFGRHIWWHPSARLDYMYFLLSSVIKLTLVLPLLISAREVALWVLVVLEQTFGYQSKLAVDSAWLVLAYTLCLFLVSDFSRYWLHRLMHKIPWLWSFHQVHHSAEVLTPITFYRVHPVENLLFGLRYALSAGLVTGVFVYFFGASLHVTEVFGVNLFVFLAHVVGDNLRHSPVRLAYPRWLESWMISPAQHQYHHTLDGNRYNFGGVLAVWDRLFGSLRYSRANEVFVFGVDAAAQFKTLGQLLLSPFLQIVNLRFYRWRYENQK